MIYIVDMEILKWRWLEVASEDGDNSFNLWHCMHAELYSLILFFHSKHYTWQDNNHSNNMCTGYIYNELLYYD